MHPRGSRLVRQSMQIEAVIIHLFGVAGVLCHWTAMPRLPRTCEHCPAGRRLCFHRERPLHSYHHLQIQEVAEENMKLLLESVDGHYTGAHCLHYWTPGSPGSSSLRGRLPPPRPRRGSDGHPAAAATAAASTTATSSRRWLLILL